MTSLNWNNEKAAYGLLGILSGVQADEPLGRQELLFLETWLGSQRAGADNADLLDILYLIGDVMEKQLIPAEELEDLNGLLHDIVHYRGADYIDLPAKVSQLRGILEGIGADQVITASELEFLMSWLRENREVENTFIGSEIARQIKYVLADGMVSPEESEHLLAVVAELTGDSFEETGIAAGLSTEFFSDDPDAFSNQDKRLCFTGKFISFTRSAAEEAAIAGGASLVTELDGNTDALIIGTLVGLNWREHSVGQKIVAALELRKAGSELVILSERSWLELTQGGL